MDFRAHGVLASATIYLMVDSAEQVDAICQKWTVWRYASSTEVRALWSLFGKANAQSLKQVPLTFCLDLDVAWRPMKLWHIGAHRSPCRTTQDMDKVIRAINSYTFARLRGCMAYEVRRWHFLSSF